MTNNPLPVRAADRGRLFLVLAGLYLAQSIPIYLITAAIPPILREVGASRTAIGLISVMMLPFVFRFLWAPTVDRFRPFVIGHRRGWILPTQLGVVGAIGALSFADPAQIWPVYIFALAISVLISTQDIATDGYATKMLAPADRPMGNAIQAGAVALSVVICSALSLVLYEHFGWQPTILVVAALSALPLSIVAIMKEETGTAPGPHSSLPLLGNFIKRPEAIEVLMIALVYRGSEGLVKAMEGPYLVDLNLSLSAIGYISGTSAAIAGIVGSFLAALAIGRYGMTAVLGTLGVVRTVCFSLFALHAAGIFGELCVVLCALALQTLIRYMELVALYSLYMAVASKDQPGTDFTILSCATLSVFLAGSMLAGVLADAMGYAGLFILATLLSAAATGWTVRLLRSRS